mmetsp:Transcript_34177/g.59773  ORF Transcript_34177/g.59773 Transcript_34177/m.59773 type:complete len:82 (+) Transcript_34177:1472-1717(+)
MVCDRCEAKLTEESKSKGSSNMLLVSRKRSRVEPVRRNCRLCEKSIQGLYHFCNKCAYTRGVCTMCGRKVLDTRFYKQSYV